MDKCCENCKFFEDGKCHRYPPAMAGGQLREENENGIREIETWEKGSFPGVFEEEWCGEWQEKNSKAT